MIQFKKSLSFGLFSLLLVLGSCSKNEPTSASITEIEDKGNYETVVLSLGSDMQGASDAGEDSPRVGFYEINAGGRSTAQVSFGADGQNHHVYTVIVRKNDNVVLFEKNLQWTVSNSGKRLQYDGELKIQRIRQNGVSIDPELQLVAIPNNGTLPARVGESFVYTADSQVAEVPTTATTYGTAQVYNSVPFVMSIKVKRKGPHGEDSKKLINGEENAKFKPQGNLVRFRIKNSTSAPIRVESIGRPPYYVPSLSINIKTGQVRLAEIVDPQPSNSAEYYFQWNLPSNVTIASQQTSKTYQFWTPLYFPNNDKYTPSVNQTQGAPTANLNIYLYPTSGADANKRRLKKVSLSTATTNAQRAGKQLYYDANVVASDMVLKNL